MPTNSTDSKTPEIDGWPGPERLAAMEPIERIAVYLNAIRKSMQFFVLLALAGIVAAVVLTQVHH